MAERPRDPDDCASALWGLGAGVAALAPELQRRLILLEPRSQTIALEGLGAGVGGLWPTSSGLSADFTKLGQPF